MKKLFFVAGAFIAFSAFTAVTGIWKSDGAHSQLGFTVTHLGISDISGNFKDFNITVKSEKADFSDASIELTAKVASIDTRIEARDNHLKSPDFFDAEKYPTVTFKSTGLKADGKDKYKHSGDLTIHGVTKKATFDLIYKGSVENPMSKKQTAGFQISGSIKRTEFGVGEKIPSFMVSDDVQVKADAEFAQ